MGSTVELPLWFVVLAGILAAAGLFDRLLNPAFQWYLRKPCQPGHRGTQLAPAAEDPPFQDDNAAGAD